MLHPLYRAQLLLALLPEWTGALVPVPGGNRPGRPSGHVISGVSIAGAGVVPYVDLPGRGIHFLLQGLTNGTRAGKLSDFGGRREEGDNDAFFTAARELCEETGARAPLPRVPSNCQRASRDDARRRAPEPRTRRPMAKPLRSALAGFLFGDVEGIASSLRTSSTVRILNRQGRYVCYFLKVEYLPSAMVSSVDATSEEHASRELRWWHADELLGSVPEEQLLERMLTGADVSALPAPPFLSSASKAPSKSSQVKSSPSKAPSKAPSESPSASSASTAASVRQGVSAFHRAVFKTMTLENAHAAARPGSTWQSNVLSTLAARQAEDVASRRYLHSIAAATTPKPSALITAPVQGSMSSGGSSGSTSSGGSSSGSSGSSSSSSSSSSSGSSSAGIKRGSRRGPAKVAKTDVPWQLGRSALREGWLGNDSPNDDSPRDDSPRDSPRDRSPALQKRRRRAPEIAHEIALPDFDGFSP